MLNGQSFDTNTRELKAMRHRAASAVIPWIDVSHLPALAHSTYNASGSHRTAFCRYYYFELTLAPAAPNQKIMMLLTRLVRSAQAYARP